MHFRISGLIAAALFVVLGAAPADAQRTQAGVTSGEIQRLQQAVDDVASDVAGGPANEMQGLQAELDELQEEVIYLKVKLRRERVVRRSEYTQVRDRIEAVRAKTRTRYNTGRAGDSNTTRSNPDWNAPRGGVSGGTVGGVSGGTGTSGSTGTTRRPEDPYPTSRARGARTIPSGQELDVRLTRPLSSDTAQVEDTFEATTVVDLLSGEQVLIPEGSVVRGVVTSVQKAGRVERKGSLTVSFDQITVNGRTYPIRATVTQALESEGIKGEAGRIGTGAGVGAIIGGILGGLKGAIAGILIGGGGVVAATEGKDVHLPAGTVLRLRFDSDAAIGGR